MSLPVSLSSAPLPLQRAVDPHPKQPRHCADFHPCIWGDTFLTYTPRDPETHALVKQQIDELKEEVREELKATARNSARLLNFIDSIQRLGLEYQFEREIDKALEEIYQIYTVPDDDIDDQYKLSYESLRFRLLRQQGYNIPSDVFKKFKDEDGNFKESLTADVHGLLALYEAANLMVHEEDILEEALTFSRTHLQSIATESTHPLAAVVSSALTRPIRKNLTKVEARQYMSVYDQDDSHSKTLLELAKLDFNLLQTLHRKELSEAHRWWRSLDVEKKMSYARNRLVEGYFWIMGVYFEPKYSIARRFTLKVISIISIIDDIYDAYGTFEELQIFTRAIERWDVSCIDELPDYMKHCYKAMLDVFEEMEQEMAKQGNLYRVQYAKEEVIREIQAYLVEATWLKEEYTPTMEEYMSVALVSCGYSMLIITSFVGMGDLATKEAFDWASSNPKMVRASCIVCRLMDDIVSHEFEQKRGHVASAIECYMKQYGSCKQEAYDDLNKQVVNAWKDINEECLKPTPVPMPLLARALNFTRVMHILYQENDEYTHVGELMRGLIASVLLYPVPT